MTYFVYLDNAFYNHNLKKTAHISGDNSQLGKRFKIGNSELFYKRESAGADFFFISVALRCQ